MIEVIGQRRANDGGGRRALRRNDRQAECRKAFVEELEKADLIEKVGGLRAAGRAVLPLEEAGRAPAAPPVVRRRQPTCRALEGQAPQPAPDPARRRGVRRDLDPAGARGRRPTSTGSRTCATGASRGRSGGVTESPCGTAARRTCTSGNRPPEGEGWEQDEQTLDTWFSSALWTWSTLARPGPGPRLRDISLRELARAAAPTSSASTRRRSWRRATTSCSSGWRG